MSSARCPRCGFVTWAEAASCKRCGAALDSSHQSTPAFEKSHPESDSHAAQTKQDIRREGMKKIKAGAGITIVYVAVLILVAMSGYRPTNFNPRSLVFSLFPVAWLLAGVLQIVTGVSFETLSEKWDGLAGWQRGMIGVSVFVAGLIVLLIVCLIILFVLDWTSGTSRPLF